MVLFSIISPSKYFSIVTMMILVISVILSLHTIECVELHVGGENGWAIPKKSDQMYNDWASKKRFQVNDTLRFEYKTDSVLVVTEEEYEKCRSMHPIFFSNNGDTVFVLDRPGLFYFVSGVAGHCQRGLKMVVKVLDPPPAAAGNSSTHKNDAESIVFGAPYKFFPMAVFVAVFSFLGVIN